jgi:hypothetical protein
MATPDPEAVAIAAELHAAGQEVPPDILAAAGLTAPSAAESGAGAQSFGPTAERAHALHDLDRRSAEAAYQDSGPFAQRAAAMGSGAVHVYNSLKHHLGMMPDQDYANANTIDEPLEEHHGGYRLAGEALPFMIPGLNVGEGVGLAAKYGVPGAINAARFLTNPLARGAVEGAAQGAITSDNPWEGAGEGALGGMAIPGALALGSKAVNGLNLQPAARALINRWGTDKMRLTPGQMLGGMWGHVEDTLRPAIPGLETLRDNPKRDFAHNMIADAAAPAYTDSGMAMPAAQIPAAARASGMRDAYNAAEASYDPLYGSVRPYPWQPNMFNLTGNSPTVLKQMAAEAQARGTGVTDAARKKAGQVVQDINSGYPVGSPMRLPKSDMTAGDALDLRSAARTASRNLPSDPNAVGFGARPLVRNASNAVTRSLENQLPSEAIDTLRAGDQGYRHLMQVQGAIDNSGAGADWFTPAQYLRAAEEGSTARQRVTGRGLDPNIDTANNAASVFREDPKTGYAQAKLAALAGKGLVGAGLVGAHVGAPMLAAASAPLAFAYTPWGRAAIAGTSAPQKIAQRGLSMFGAGLDRASHMVPGQDLQLRNLLDKYGTQGGATLGTHEATDRYNVPMRLPGTLEGAATADRAIAGEPEVQQFAFGGPVRHDLQFADGGQAPSPTLMEQFIDHLRRSIGIIPGGGSLQTNPHGNEGAPPSGYGRDTMAEADRQSG